jgi:Lsr2
MQRVQVHLEDDLTGGPADETVRFGLDGLDYEVDLSARHATEFRRQIAPFVEHARPARSQRSRVRARTAASRERSRDIRVWAERQGFAVAEHGRLPGNVIAEYELAHGGREPAERTSQRPASRRAAPRRAKAKPQGRAKSSQRTRTTRLACRYRPHSEMAGPAAPSF